LLQSTPAPAPASLHPAATKAEAGTDRRTRGRRLWGLALTALGVLAIVWLVREAGADALQASMRRLLPWIAPLLVLEGARIGLELLQMRLLLGEHGGAVPLKTLLRAQLVSNAVAMSTPMGRPAGETVRALLLTPYVGDGRAFAIGVVGQAQTLLVNGTYAASALVVAFAWGLPGVLQTALLGMVATTLILGTGLQLLARSHAPSRLLRRIERLSAFVERLREATTSLSVMPWPALLALMASRGLQVAQLTLLIFVFGAAAGPGDGLATGLLSQGIYLLGASVGDLVPAQLGVVDGAFAMAAPFLAVPVATAVAMAIALHIAQLGWVAIGAFAGALLRPARPPQR
jgi:hypothetical protein